MALDALLFALLLLECVGFWMFYKTPHGSKAVYRTWYAWIIDILGIASGVFLMTLAIGSYHHPEFFARTVPITLIGILFVLGSWQAVIHGVKWVRRACIK